MFLCQLPVVFWSLLMFSKSANMVAPWGPRPTKLLRSPFPCRRAGAVSNGVKAFWELILSLFVVLVVLLLASSCSMFFEVVFYPLLGPLGVDFGPPRWPSEPQKPWFRFRHSLIFERSTFYLSRWSWERFGSLLGSFWVLLGVSWATFGGSWGSLGRPLGALGGIFGGLWGLQIEHQRMTRIESIRLGALDVFCWPRFAIILVLSFVFKCIFQVV